MTSLIDSISQAAPTVLTEVTALAEDARARADQSDHQENQEDQ